MASYKLKQISVFFKKKNLQVKTPTKSCIFSKKTGKFN